MKVLTVDDHSVVRAGLGPVLKRLDPDVTLLEAHDFPSALKTAEENPDLDLLLLDLMMPGMDAFEGLTAIRRLVPHVPLVVVSMIEDRQDVLRAAELGALGYIPKTANLDEMHGALRQVLSGAIYLPPAILRMTRSADESRTTSERSAALSDDAWNSLTKRQRDVVDYLARGMTNAEIADELGLSESTIRVHVSTILERLKLNNRTQVAVWADRFGRGDVRSSSDRD
jgi:RNA polymerase sigma factor (sigma-70 family)